MKRYFATLLPAVCISLAQAQTTSLSLSEAKTYGLQHNYNVLNAKADVQIARNKVKETTAIGLPQLSASGNFQQFVDIPTQVIPAQAFDPSAPADAFIGVQFGTAYSASGTLQASQLIFDGSYIVGLQSSKTYQSISNQQLTKTVLQVKQDITQSYYTVLVAYENQKVVDSTRVAMEQLFFETQKMQENGLLEVQDVDQMELTVTNLRNASQMAGRQTALAEQILKMQMGMDLKTEINLTDALSSFMGENAMATAATSTFDPASNIDYKIMMTQKDLQTLALKKEKWDRLPSLGAYFQHSQQAYRNQADFFKSNEPWFPATVWGLNLNFEIFSSGGRHARISQAKLEVEKAENFLQQMDQGLRLKVMQAQSDYLTAWESYKHNRSGFELSERIQQQILIKYKEGLASSLDLSQAQNQYFSSQGQYIQSLFNLLRAKAGLDHLFGNL